ncbi:unnamed protein product, partial [Ceratitis capitata]
RKTAKQQKSTIKSTYVCTSLTALIAANICVCNSRSIAQSVRDDNTVEPRSSSSSHSGSSSGEVCSNVRE